MKKKLLIVFVKNLELGEVKTRLAKSIGNENAFEIYKELIAITENVTSKIDFDKMIYFSDRISESQWIDSEKRIQFGADLGAKMRNAFADGFALGYDSIVLIGSDLPEISKELIIDGFDELEINDVVFGPAEDGGYYLIGMNQQFNDIFKNKPWSQPNLLNVTLSELMKNDTNFSMLKTLNDIDTYEDLIASDFYKNNAELQQKIKQFND